MRKLRVFNNVSLDGYFTDRNNDVSWAHKNDDEWVKFTRDNASGGDAVFVFGRITYEMMAAFWPTAEAKKTMPVVAEAMNSRTKMVFSRTLNKPTWQNTSVIKGDVVETLRKEKEKRGPDMLIMGSGTLIAPLTQARLIDEFMIVVHPTVLGAGRSMFEGVNDRVPLTLQNSRAFKNGAVVNWYRQ